VVGSYTRGEIVSYHHTHVGTNGGHDTVARKTNGKDSSTGRDLGFEAKLWQAADKLRSNMDVAEHKHVVLGLIFLKYAEKVVGEAV
jgi:hypothetical protein